MENAEVLFGNSENAAENVKKGKRHTAWQKAVPFLHACIFALIAFHKNNFINHTFLYKFFPIFKTNIIDE